MRRIFLGLLLVASLEPLRAADRTDGSPLFDVHALLRWRASDDGPNLRSLFPTAKVTHDRSTGIWTAFRKEGFGNRSLLDMVTVARFKGQLLQVAVTFKEPVKDRPTGLALIGLKVAPPPTESKGWRWSWMGIDGIYKVDAMADRDGSEACSTILVYPDRLLLLKSQAADR